MTGLTVFPAILKLEFQEDKIIYIYIFIIEEEYIIIEST